MKTKIFLFEVEKRTKKVKIKNQTGLIRKESLQSLRKNVKLLRKILRIPKMKSIYWKFPLKRSQKFITSRTKTFKERFDKRRDENKNTESIIANHRKINVNRKP
jgi:hypothetical protein